MIIIMVSLMIVVKSWVWFVLGLVFMFGLLIDLLMDIIVFLMSFLVLGYVLCLVDDDYCFGYGKVEVLVGFV